MKKVICLDDGTEYLFTTNTSYEAMKSMLYTLNLSHKDGNAKIELHNGRTLSLTHNGKTYACMI